MIEFLRFGSAIAGAQIGCCAVDVIQGFSCDPMAKASIQLVDGDSASPCIDSDGNPQFLGPTNLDIFKQRLRIGTFYNNELPCHAFLAVFSDFQINSPYNTHGRDWLRIVKEHGFEFVRAVRNSVYSSYRPPVYLFGLFRNIGKDSTADPFLPPAAWTELPECTLTQQEVWDRDTLRTMTEAELRAEEVPVYLAGQRGTPPKIKRVEEVIDTSEVFVEDEFPEYSEFEELSEQE